MLAVRGVGWGWTTGLGSGNLWVWYRLDGPTSAGFALLTHLLIVGYVGGLAFFLFGGGTLLVVLIDGKDAYPDTDLISIAVYTSMFVGGLVAMIFGRLFERLAAKHCIRLYLRRPTTSD